MRVPKALAALLAAAALLSCGRLTVPHPHTGPPEDQAAAVLEHLAGANPGLLRFKGVGRFSHRRGERRWSARAVWAVELPDRLRVDLMAAGRPAVRFADDGFLFSLLTHTPEGEVRVRRRPSAEGSLEQALSFKLRTGDVAALMAGRLPVRPYREVRLIPKPDTAVRHLELYDDRGRIVQRVRIDGLRSELVRVEYFSPPGRSSFRVDVVETRVVDGYRVPARLLFRDDAGAELDLRVERMMTNVSLTSELFRPKAPDALRRE